MPRPKRHHFVTKAYLDGFLEPGQTQLYCWPRHQTGFFRSVPERIAFERNYHSIKRPDGSWDDFAEDFIAQKIEDPGLRVLRKLTSGNTRIGWKDRGAFSLLLALQEYRVPSFRRSIEKISDQFVLTLVREYEEMTAEKGAIGPIELESRRGISKFTADELKRELERRVDSPGKPSLVLFVRQAFSIARIYQHLKWTIHHAAGTDRFVTSDSPVIKVFHRGPGGKAALAEQTWKLDFRCPGPPCCL